MKLLFLILLRSLQTGRLETLTAEQIFELEKEFNLNKYLASARREEVADSLKLGEELIEAWFEHRRVKRENEMKAGEGSSDMNAEVSMEIDPQVDEQTLELEKEFQLDPQAFKVRTVCQYPRPNLSKSELKAWLQKRWEIMTDPAVYKIAVMLEGKNKGKTNC